MFGHWRGRPSRAGRWCRSHPDNMFGHWRCRSPSSRALNLVLGAMARDGVPGFVRITNGGASRQERQTTIGSHWWPGCRLARVRLGASLGHVRIVSGTGTKKPPRRAVRRRVNNNLSERMSLESMRRRAFNHTYEDEMKGASSWSPPHRQYDYYTGRNEIKRTEEIKHLRSALQWCA